MTNLSEIERLYEMKKNGIISEAEFEAQKTKLLQPGNGNKNQLVYCLLALFFGVFGIHNFYAGRWKRGLAQLLISLFTLFLGATLTYLWAIVNIFTIHTDGKGNEFEPSKTGKFILGTLGILVSIRFLMQIFVFVLGIKGMVGNSAFAVEYEADELRKYSAQISVLTFSENWGRGIATSVECYSLLTPPEFFMGRCVAYPGGKLVFSGIDENVKKVLVDREIMKEDSFGNLIFPYK